MRISEEQIIHIGLSRIKGVCALCENKMDLDNYNIQLCRSCRMKSMDKIIKEENKGDGYNKMRWLMLKKGFASSGGEE